MRMKMLLNLITFITFNVLIIILGEKMKIHLFCEIIHDIERWSQVQRNNMLYKTNEPSNDQTPRAGNFFFISIQINFMTELEILSRSDFLILLDFSLRSLLRFTKNILVSSRKVSLICTTFITQNDGVETGSIRTLTQFEPVLEA